jgi:hypothetical protein
MSYNPLTEDWFLCEVELTKSGQKYCVCSVAWKKATHRELIPVYRQLLLLRAAGCPPHPMKPPPKTTKVFRCHPYGQNVKVAERIPETLFEADRTTLAYEVQVYKLKTKSEWRLYFYVQSAAKRRIEFLYAVQKKRDEENKEDRTHACNLLADIASGRTGSAALVIPDL